MKETRSIVNAVFSFVIFLMIYGFFVAGHVRGTPDTPRFLRMEVEEGDEVHPRHREHLSFSMPYALFRGGLKMAAAGRLRQEMETHFRQSLEAEEVKKLWKELSETPEGSAVVKEIDGTRMEFTRNQGTVTFSVSEKPEGEDQSPEKVTIQFPASLLENLATQDEPFDMDTLLTELPRVNRGEVLKVESPEGRVRVWIE